MKSVLTIMIAIGLLSSCKKENIDGFYYFTIKTENAMDGAVLQNFEFSVLDNNYGYSILDEQTDSNGLYLGSLESADNNIYINSYRIDYEVLNSSTQLIGGEHNSFSLEVVGRSTLQMSFICSGGFIQNCKRVPLNTIPVGSAIYNRSEAKERSYYTSCGASYSDNVFSGQWIVSYEKRPTTSSLWVTYTDTIDITPGEDFEYSITY